MGSKCKLVVGVALASTVLLAGCGSSGVSGVGSSSLSGGSSGGSSAAARATGPTIASTLDQGAIIVSDRDATTALRTIDGSNTASVGAPASVQVRKNFVGGVDVSIEGDVVSLQDKHTGADATSWSRSGSGYSLALWNAGRGGRDGLFRNEQGQKYHKIIGYRHFDKSNDMLTRGHAIIGNQTSNAAMAKLTREIDYEGYFYANTAPAASPTEAKTGSIVGGLRMTADFDKGTVVGRSRTFEAKNPGDLGHLPTGDTMKFNGTISGSSYAGNINSTNAQLNGAAVNGAFYGAGAQETAGIISGQNASGTTEGYFTASGQ